MSNDPYDLDSFSLIGTGAVGSALAAGLVGVGCRIDYVVSRRRSSASDLCGELDAGQVLSITDPLLAESRLLLLAVPDDALSEVAADLAEAGTDWSDTVVLHTSGALDSRVLQPVRALGATVGSFHPIQTFGPGADASIFEGITVGIEGDTKATAAGRALADALHARYVELDADRKALYHTAAVITGNYLTALLGVASEIWEEAVDAEIPYSDALGPLASQSLENALRHGPGRSMTGPVVRGDLGTIEKQMDALNESAGHLLPFYGVMAVESVHMAVRAGRLTPEEAVPLLDAIHARLDGAYPSDEE